MGYMKHHAIVVTGYDDHSVVEDPRRDIPYVWSKAERMFPAVSSLTPRSTNGYQSFLVPPDGSKEGWPESHDGDARREEFIKYLKSLAYGDGSTPVSWALVCYGDDERKAVLEDASDFIPRIG